MPRAVRTALRAQVARNTADIAEIMGRIGMLDGPEPPVDVDPFDAGVLVTHEPLDVDAVTTTTVFRSRQADKIANALYLYQDEHTPLGPQPRITNLIVSGPPAPVVMSPKNVTDDAAARALLAQIAEAGWAPFWHMAFWQEPYDPFVVRGTEAAYIDTSNRFYAICDDYGVSSGPHVEAFHIGPYAPKDGYDGTRRLVDGVIAESTRVLWSVFEYHEHEMAATHAANIAEFMTAYPEMPWAVASYGDALPPWLTVDDPRRLARADRVGRGLRAFTEAGAEFVGYYAPGIGPKGFDFNDIYLDNALCVYLQEQHP